ncbi:MAG: tetratricopeptide repeat protein, partial [Lysobacteraceae bacterium]
SGVRWWARAAPAINMLGVVRLKQGRFAEAENLFLQARAAVPNEPLLAFNVGRALVGQGRAADAIAAFRAALSLKPDFAEALYEMGALLHQAGQLAEAEAAFRLILSRVPGHPPANLMLGNVLIDAGRPAEAEAPLRRGLSDAQEPGLKAVLHNNLGRALRRQRRDADALAQYDSARALNPALPDIDLHRAEALQNLQRHDEALAVFESAIAREPANPALHQYYNDLLYRLDRKDDFLTSYDRAPQSRDLQLAKAWFLASDMRGEEAHAIYRGLLKTDANDLVAAAGAANTLSMMKRPREALAMFETMLARHDGDGEILGSAAEAALLAGDPVRAFAERDRTH